MKVKDVLKDIADKARFVMSPIYLDMDIIIRHSCESQIMKVEFLKTQESLIVYTIEYRIGHLWNDVKVEECSNYDVLTGDVLVRIQEEVAALSRVAQENTRLVEIAKRERQTQYFKQLDEFLNKDIT